MIATDDRVARFVSDRLGYALCPPFTCIGIEQDGEIVAGCVFNHFEGHDVHVTIAGAGWTRGFIGVVGDYVFNQLQCARMTAITRDEKVIEYARRLGGKVEGVLREHFGSDGDGTVVGILKREFKAPPLNKARL